MRNKTYVMLLLFLASGIFFYHLRIMKYECRYLEVPISGAPGWHRVYYNVHNPVWCEKT